MKNVENENEFEFYDVEAFIVGLKKHLFKILQEHSSLGLEKDWSQHVYSECRFDATYLMYNILTVLVQQFKSRNRYSVATAKVVIPLTKHLNKMTSKIKSEPAKEAISNNSIDEVKYRHMKNELANNRKLVETLQQYKDLYMSARVEIKKLKSHSDKAEEKNAIGTEEISQKVQELEKGEVSQKSSLVFQKISQLLAKLEKNSHQGNDTVFNLGLELKGLMKELSHLERTFSYQIPLIRQIADKLPDFSFEELLKKVELLEKNTNKMQSTIAECDSNPGPDNTQKLDPSAEATERLIAHLHSQIAEYKSCIVTVESQHDELLEENLKLKAQLSTSLDESDEILKYVNELERKDKKLAELQKKNQILESQLLEFLK